MPYLEHEGARIWETTAICEYCAEFAPALWPADRLARAHARSIAAEMHAGFRALRQSMTMNLGRPDYAGLGRTPETLADIARIETLWAETRAAFGATGPYLFGAEISPMRTPCSRPWWPASSPTSRNFPPPRAPIARPVRAHPLMATWYDLAAQEPESWHLQKYESLA